VKLTLRFLFYASPIIYSLTNLPHELHIVSAFNPLSGIFALYRSAFFPLELKDHWLDVTISGIMCLAIFGIGLLVFRRTIRAVLKEI
jgi:ABC-2 type transport system permease protein